MSRKKVVKQPLPSHCNRPSFGASAYLMADGEQLDIPDPEYARVYPGDVKSPKEFPVITRKATPEELAARRSKTKQNLSKKVNNHVTL